MVEVMWLIRGAQSALFYYVSCSPCSEFRYKRKRRRDAVRSRAERSRLEVEQPHLIPQPMPFTTNPHWSEEIATGPQPLLPRKRGHSQKQALQQRQRTRRDDESSNGTGTTGTMASVADESTLRSIRPLDRALQFGRSTVAKLQREDEELWGEFHDLSSRSRERSSRGSSVGFPGLITRGRADTGDSDKCSFTAKPPSIDDPLPVFYDGPIARNKRAARWILQPPPSAKLMSGKEPVPVKQGRSRGRISDPQNVSVRMPAQLDGDIGHSGLPVSSGQQDFVFQDMSSLPSQEPNRGPPGPTVDRVPKPHHSLSESSRKSQQPDSSPTTLRSFRPSLPRIQSASRADADSRKPRDSWNHYRQDSAPHETPRSSESTLTSRTPSSSISPTTTKDEVETQTRIGTTVHDHPDPDFPYSSIKKPTPPPAASELFYWHRKDFGFGGGLHRKQYQPHHETSPAAAGLTRKTFQDNSNSRDYYYEDDYYSSDDNDNYDDHDHDREGFGLGISVPTTTTTITTRPRFWRWSMDF